MANKTLFQDLKTVENDIDFYLGDMTIFPSDEQHIIDIMECFPGEYKQFPEVGVGVSMYLLSSGQQQSISRNTRVQLLQDGYQVINPSFSIDDKGNLKVAPHAVR